MLMNIYISNLTIKYKKFILGPINAILKPGLNVVLGPNGSGKTTFFRAIAGVLKPDSGGIRIDNSSSINNVVGYLPQEISFEESITVTALIKYLSNLLNINKKILNDLINIFELNNYINNKVYELSSGMKRKLAIAVIISTKRPVLLLDEPFTGLDNRSLLQIIYVLRQLIEEKINIVISSHTMEFVYNVLPISSILILNKGKQLFFGNTKLLIEEARCRFYIGQSIESYVDGCNMYSVCGQPRIVCPCNNLESNCNYKNLFKDITIFDLYNCILAVKGDVE